MKVTKRQVLPRDTGDRVLAARPDLRATLLSLLREFTSEIDKAERQEAQRSEAEFERRSKAAMKGWEGRRGRAGAGY